MSRLITVTAKHRRFQSIVLIMCVTKEGQHAWRKWQVKHESFSTKTWDDTQFKNDLLLSFSLCGCDQSLWVIRGGTRKEVYDHLNQTLIPEDIRLCYLGSSGKAPGNLEIHIRDDCSRYGDLFGLWGKQTGGGGGGGEKKGNAGQESSYDVVFSKYVPNYRYPDSWRLELERFNPVTKSISVVTYKDTVDLTENFTKLRLFWFRMFTSE